MVPMVIHACHAMHACITNASHVALVLKQNITKIHPCTILNVTDSKWNPIKQQYLVKGPVAVNAQTLFPV